MSGIEMTYEKDVLEPKVEPPKTLAEQQRDALLVALRALHDQFWRSDRDYRVTNGGHKGDIFRQVLAAIEAVESGKVPS